MEKTLFEQMGGTYTRVGDYFLPDLKLPEEKTKHIGVWGQKHKRCKSINERLILLCSQAVN